MEKQDFRYVQVKGITYLRIEDVVYIKDIGATEGTDTCNRLTEAANNISQVGK